MSLYAATPFDSSSSLPLSRMAMTIANAGTLAKISLSRIGHRAGIPLNETQFKMTATARDVVVLALA